MTPPLSPPVRCLTLAFGFAVVAAKATGFIALSETATIIIFIICMACAFNGKSSTVAEALSAAANGYRALKQTIKSK